MEITYLGHSSFKLRGKAATVVTDPFDPAFVGQVEESPFVVNGQGEYEIKGVGIVGLSVFHDDSQGSARGKNTIYRIEIDGVSVVHLGDIGHTLNGSQVDGLDGVDVLLVPVGGVYTIDAAKAITIIHEVEPSIVIPMHSGRPELDQKAFGELSPIGVFLKEIGKDSVPQAKLSVTKDKIPEEMQVVVLE